MNFGSNAISNEYNLLQKNRSTQVHCTATSRLFLNAWLCLTSAMFLLMSFIQQRSQSSSTKADCGSGTCPAIFSEASKKDAFHSFSQAKSKSSKTTGCIKMCMFFSLQLVYWKSAAHDVQYIPALSRRNCCVFIIHRQTSQR